MAFQEAFIQRILYPRPGGQGRAVMDERSYVVPWVTSAQQIAGHRGQVNSHVLVYGTGPLPPMPTRHVRNSSDIPTQGWKRIRDVWRALSDSALGTPIPITASTPAQPVGKASYELPPVYYSNKKPGQLAALVSLMISAVTSDSAGRTPLTVGAPEARRNEYHEFITPIKYRLLEPPAEYNDQSVWQLWDQDEITEYVNRRASRFCLETGMNRKVQIIPQFLENVSAQGLITIPSDTMEIRRVSYTGPNGISIPLVKADMHTLSFGLGTDWETLVGDPVYWMSGPLPLSESIRLVPSPTPGLATDVCTLTIHYVPNNTPSGGGTNGDLDTIPACMIPYVRWGVIADMLMKQGEAFDPVRANYCEQRFAEGIELAKATVGREA